MILKVFPMVAMAFGLSNTEWPVKDSFLPQGLAFNTKGHVVKSIQGSHIEQGLTKEGVLRFRWEGKYVAEWDSKKLLFKILSQNEEKKNSWARLIQFSEDREIERMSVCEKYILANRSGVMEIGGEGSYREFDGCLTYDYSFCRDLLGPNSALNLIKSKNAQLQADVKTLQSYFKLFNFSFPFADIDFATTKPQAVKAWGKAIDTCEYLIQKTRSFGQH